MSVHFPESFSLASILAERCVCHQEGLNQNDWRTKWQPLPVFLLEHPRGRGAWLWTRWPQLLFLSAAKGLGEEEQQ